MAVVFRNSRPARRGSGINKQKKKKKKDKTFKFYIKLNRLNEIK
jgi:hypothetical protein